MANSIVKSFKNTLIEYVILNTDHWIPTLEQSLREVKDSSKSILRLPTGLFEEIMKMSDNMCWEIPLDHMIYFIAHREAFNWKSIKYFHEVCGLDIHDICSADIRSDQLSLSSFKATIDLENKKDVSKITVISDNASTLMHLDLTIRAKYKTDKNETRKLWEYLESMSNKCPPLTLTRLRLEAERPNYLALRLDAQKLTVLELHRPFVTVSLLEMIVVFKNLFQLSLSDLFLVDISIERVVDVVVTLNKLRVLCLHVANFMMNETGLNKILSCLENLEVLETSFIDMRSTCLVEPKRKLKVLLYQGLFPATTVNSERLRTLTHRVGHSETVDGLLIFCEESTAKRDFFHTVDTLKLNFTKGIKEIEKAEDLMRFELQVLKAAKECSIDGNFNFMDKIPLPDDLLPLKYSPGFLSKMTCLRCSKYKQMVPSMVSGLFLESMKVNSETNLSKRCQRFSVTTV